MGFLRKKRAEKKVKANPSVVVGVAQKHVQFPQLATLLFKRKKLIAFVVCAVILVISGLVFLNQVQTKKPETGKEAATSVCSGADQQKILQEVANNIALGKTDKVKSYIDQRVRDKDHERDPDCIYIFATYYVKKGDPKKAKEYIDKLDKIKFSGKPSETLVKAGVNLDTLKTQVNTLDASTSKSNNFQGVTYVGDKQ